MKKFFGIFLGSLLLQSGFLFSAPPDVKVDTIIPSGGIATFLPSDDVVSARYVGLEASGRNPDFQPLDASTFGGSKKAFFFITRGLAEGEYRFYGVWSNATGEQTAKVFSVQVGQKKDDDKKDDDKKDDDVIPPPVPITTDAYFVVIEETSERTPARAVVLDFTYWDALGLKGRYLFIDDDTTKVEDKEYITLLSQWNEKQTVKVSQPALMALDKQGNILKAIPLPVERKGIAEFVKSITGK